MADLISREAALEQQYLGYTRVSDTEESSPLSMPWRWCGVAIARMAESAQWNTYCERWIKYPTHIVRQGNGGKKMRLIRGRSFYKEPWYGSYHSMMDRCYRETAKNYPYYGGRGIKVCTEWHDITAFEKWVHESGYQEGLTLERKEPDKDYSPDNCKWATPKEQANNRRNTLFLEYNGERHSAGEWAEILGISRSTITSRYYRGLPMEKVLIGGRIWDAKID